MKRVIIKNDMTFTMPNMSVITLSKDDEYILDGMYVKTSQSGSVTAIMAVISKSGFMPVAVEVDGNIELVDDNPRNEDEELDN